MGVVSYPHPLFYLLNTPLSPPRQMHDPTPIILLKKFLRFLGIWDFPRFPGIWGIPEISLKFPKELKNGIFLRFWKFLKLGDIWGIPQMLGNQENSPRTGNLREFPKYVREISGIAQIQLGIWENPKCLGIWTIPQTSYFLQKYNYSSPFTLLTLQLPSLIITQLTAP